MSHSVLSDMDWDEGIAMPVANNANKLLEDQVSCITLHYNFIQLINRLKQMQLLKFRKKENLKLPNALFYPLPLCVVINLSSDGSSH